MNYLKIIVKKLIKEKFKSQANLFMVKRQFAKKYKVACPKNSALLLAYHKLLKQGKIKKNESFERFLRTKRIRSLSGVVSVSVLTKPAPCPGKCLYCPDQANLPKSYLDGEPAVMRAVANNFNPYLQIKTRLKTLEANSHNISKIELIIIGGTWSSLPIKYQTQFIKECFRACNEYDGKRYKNKKLSALQKINEKARHRIIGITIETRPDYINIIEIKKLRNFGVTRVELGAQSLNNIVLKKNLRGHGVNETILATKLLKNAGFKICYHMMPNLPGSNLEKDEKMFTELFNNPDFQPDFLKIYPCVVVKEAPLYKIWLKGKYHPYSDRQLINLLVKVKQKIPIWCRIIRIYRDIPSNKIIAGSKISNLRQIIVQELKKQEKKCVCIRCREVRGKLLSKDKLKIFRQDYLASNGKEVFLTFEDKARSYLYSLLRLRLSKENPELAFPILKNAAIMREIHTYGETIGFNQKIKTSPQHRSLGKELIKASEKIALSEGFKKMAVIAGVGSRNYYRMLGYRLKNTYMIKNL
ncbi:MAG: tRNA uridine(34) 5-carboxymethylaminomethyl modification radical SAM/GNAT enzyme Elp3 [Parcubacteria group bacterium CG_4_10_14_0_2_um_filter_7_35_8]|nr:MAG: tRNA uridine(34) 5-carboxymethylaminomethyl modification radical SAM/GNAT enzyme Elp3 [Parcubacteria group bacterium CG10_big_fil_rev_8_21_14_0_10_35_15]PIZ76890.1 MAG: tRNA uridine(34) 5-carboxymethylaminomethyl modification radical SAM/GNAT enzyme Elp3 [Parcubacteria group bacterium CG_4_10_14_0_2_um_filter_7_35_8]